MNLEPQPGELAFPYMLRTLKATAPANIRPILGPEVLAEALARTMGELIEQDSNAQQALFVALRDCVQHEIAAQSRERN